LRRHLDFFHLRFLLLDGSRRPELGGLLCVMLLVVEVAGDDLATTQAICLSMEYGSSEEHEVIIELDLNGIR
jgi:hypothetical protein